MYKTPLAVDPGWNDPPLLNYTPDNPPPKSRIKNKRVAFPLSSAGAQSGGAVLPKVTAFPGPGEEFQRTVDNFMILLNEVEGVERVELKQKLEVLKKSWTEGALPPSAQNYVYVISDFLCKRDVVKANEIQLKLTMEHGAVCANWMGLIRGVVAVIQAKK